ncbi:secreted RxLR effector protein 161-like [Pistacia vera]|uniref:secreted RxLR effector protein 161-like n=1 Tax=Pistacia vera TaxID=55513 RepID=UPI001262C542|nr:secreted RxLR effector protein 161-like [Pistacia vera]
MENVPYANAIGSVMHTMISTRPDLSFTISLLSSLCQTLVLNTGFVDSDFTSDKDTRKSTTAYLFTVGGNCVSWKSQLQPMVPLSSTKAEYEAMADIFKESLWLQGLLSEVELLETAVTVYSDS